MDWTTLAVVGVIFLATVVRSTFGFGEALVAVPLLAMVIPIKVAAPVAVLASITIAAVVVAQDWRHVHLNSAIGFLLPTLVGIPIGVILLTRVEPGAVKAALAVVIVAFSAFSLLGKKPPELKKDSVPWLLGCGFLAGVLGGAYGTNAPPLVAYGAMRRWTPQHFRATLQAYFLPASLVGLIGFRLAGIWVPDVTRYFLVSLPGMIPAIFIGREINRRIHGENFVKFVHAGLIAVGGLLLTQAVRGL